MKNSFKGALLSGLVFPGLGQIRLKHYTQGISLMFTVLACLVVIVIKALQQAFTILENVESGDGAIDMSPILNAAIQASSTDDNFIPNIASILIILCWVIGVVGAYRLGRRKDLAEQSKDQGSK